MSEVVMKNALLLIAGLTIIVAASGAGAQTRKVFNAASPKGARTPFNLNVTNECRRRHVFEVSRPTNMNWFKLEDAPRLTLSPGESRPVKAQIDTEGMTPDSYDGEVEVRCTDCASEPGCTQDHMFFAFQLEVTASLVELQATRQATFLPGEILVVLPSALPDINGVIRQLAAAYQLTLIESFPVPSISGVCARYAVQGRSVAEAIIAVSGDSRVVFVEQNSIYRGFQSGYNDALATQQYGPKNIRVDAAHRRSKGKGVRVAIIDTGVDTNQIDLRNRVAATANFTGDATFNEDAHGTLVAGIIAATPNNRIGIYGVAPGASLIAIKALTPISRGSIDAAGSTATIAKGMEFAIAVRAQVINLSLGGPKSRLLTRQIKAAFSGGITLVAAAGNDGPDGPPAFPASLSRVIAVSAIDSRDELYESATRGDYISVVAPGVEIMSTLPSDRFNAFTGTSMAAPHVTGVVALLLEERPALQPGEVRSLLEATARRLGGGGKSPLFGSGCIDACRALATLTENRKLCK